MAATGLFLVLFLLAHMLGNLQLFRGPDAINGYAASLKSIGLLLWGFRGALIVALVVHVTLAIWLSLGNRAARPERYRRTQRLATGWSARTMLYTGLGVGFFVVYHLAHFTVLFTHPEYRDLVDAQGRHDVYQMVVIGFQNQIVAGLYIAAVFFVCLHLSHAISSLFQSLGIRHPKYTPFLEKLSTFIAVVLFAGFVSVPISVLLGWVGSVGGAS